METQSDSSVTDLEFSKKTQQAARYIFMSMWFLTTITFVVLLVLGVRENGTFDVARNLIHAAYVGSLLWYLISKGPSVKEYPDIGPIVLKQSKAGRVIPVVVIAVLFLMAFQGFEDIFRLLLLIAAPWMLVAWRREIRLISFLQGLAAAGIAFLGGFYFFKNGYFDNITFILLLAYIPLMFAAGGLLHKRTGLGGSQLYAGRYKVALVSFLWGCLLFIPLGLANAAAGSPGTFMTWVTRWWIPLLQPFWSGIEEELVFRFVLVGLCYFLLRPAFKKRPAVAVVCSVFFSATIFGLGHSGTLSERFLMTGMLYGLPLAAVFTRRDWEYAVGAHYMINFIPTLMVFLER